MDNEVVVNLGKVLSELLPKAIAEGLEKVGQTIENDAKRNCPVDDGQLRASLTHRVLETESTVEIGTTVEYAPYVHEGTGIHASGGRQTPWVYMRADGSFITTSGSPPKPFLQDAVDENLAKIPKIFEGLLDKQKGGL
jgi:hypothetical protein